MMQHCMAPADEPEPPCTAHTAYHTEEACTQHLTQMPPTTVFTHYSDKRPYIQFD